MKLTARDPYSYHGDETVPAFDDSGPIVFMDGECVLCTRSARLLARLDRTGIFRICPIQTPLGRGILEHYGLDPGDPDSWLYLESGKAYTLIDGMIRAGRHLGGWGNLLRPLGFLPRPAQDWLYRRVARNRYSLFGRTDVCTVPDPALRRRLMT
jgi:predicted DCC family thiol-disulfide oxidoreductase YuxK